MENLHNEKKRTLFRDLIALGALFASFIALCGATHTLRALQNLYPNLMSIVVASEVMLWFCAAVSIATAFVGLRLFPVILEILGKFELNSEGNLENAENYLLEVVEMVKESIMVINDNCEVERCNEAAKVMFARDIVGKRVTNYVHPEDAERFNQAILRVLGSYNFAPVTIEYRIKVSREENSLDLQLSFPNFPLRLPALADNRIHCDNSEIPDNQVGFSPDTVNMALNALSAHSEELEYVWIESTICKGMRLTKRDDLEYDLKMASRNINDRMKRTLGDV